MAPLPNDSLPPGPTLTRSVVAKSRSRTKTSGTPLVSSLSFSSRLEAQLTNAAKRLSGVRAPRANE